MVVVVVLFVCSLCAVGVGGCGVGGSDVVIGSTDGAGASFVVGMVVVVLM